VTLGAVAGSVEATVWRRERSRRKLRVRVRGPEEQEEGEAEARHEDDMAAPRAHARLRTALGSVGDSAVEPKCCPGEQCTPLACSR